MMNVVLLVLCCLPLVATVTANQLEYWEYCGDRPEACPEGESCYRKKYGWAGCLRDELCRDGKNYSDWYDHVTWECTKVEQKEILVCPKMGLKPSPGVFDNEGFARKHGRLYLDGVQLKGSKSGEAVRLIGMSSHGLQWFPDCYTFESMQVLVKQWGINIFRAVVYVGEGGYATNRTIKDKAIQIVEWCEKLGIYVIIDWHVLQPGDPNVWLDCRGCSTGMAIDFWKEMATRYAHRENVLYELANEPNSVGWPIIKQYHDAVIGEIRKIDPQAVIICGTGFFSQLIGEAYENPVLNGTAKNILYSLHFYAGTQVYLYDVLKKYINKLPLIVSEWGTTESFGGGQTYFQTARKFLKLLSGQTNVSGVKVPMLNWSYGDRTETSAALAPYSCPAKQWNRVLCSGRFLRTFIQTMFHQDDAREWNNRLGLPTAWFSYTDSIALQ